MTSRVLVAILLLVSAVSEARPIHYGAVESEALAGCDSLDWQGGEAGPCYQALIDGDASDAIRAEAAWALGDLHLANRLFQAADQQTPNDPALLTRWGDLYADTHQDAEAMNIYREALAADGQYAFALLGAANLLLGAFDDAANAYLEPLLTNSSLHEGARAAGWLLVARAEIENGNIDEAESNLEDAEALIERNGWPPLEAFALRAAIDVVNNRPDSEWFQRSLDYNPGWGGIYSTPAYIYVITRRYRDAIDLYQRAVDIEPGLAAAHEELGVNLLRDNQISRARRHLETAHDADPFSPVAVNTLRLLDSFSDFPIIQDPETPTGDGEVPIVLRLHKDEAAAIAPYAIAMTRRSIDEFSRRYQFELREPVVIEMYPDHQDFAVRTAGMPGIGILGATFGYLLAMDSPSARTPDQFQWGTTLWHELAHVFTLEASNHLVPRWFSEGVSVYEEWRSGPTPGVRLPMNVYAAMRDDKFLPVADLDEGFIRPSYEDQVIVSYMQAGLICQFIDQHYGEDKLALMLKAFADGADSSEALEQVLDVSTSAFDSAFEVYLDLEHGRFLGRFDDWNEARTEASKAFSEDDWDAAIAAAKTMIDLHPDYTEPDSPYLLLARAHGELEDADGERAALERFWDRGGYEPVALRKYATLLAEEGNQDGAIAVLERVIHVQPLANEVHQQLGELLLETGKPQAALSEFQIVLAQGAYDQANAYFQIARAHEALGDIDATRDNLLMALDIAPGYREAQRLLLDVMSGKSETNQ